MRRGKGWKARGRHSNHQQTHAAGRKLEPTNPTPKLKLFKQQ